MHPEVIQFIYWLQYDTNGNEKQPIDWADQNRSSEIFGDKSTTITTTAPLNIHSNDTLQISYARAHTHNQFFHYLSLAFIGQCYCIASNENCRPFAGTY